MEQTILPKITHSIQQVMEQTILPKISAIVKQQVELAIEKPLTRLSHHSGIGVKSSESRTLQLVFMAKLSLPVVTNSPIPFGVALVDATTKQVVTSGLEASAKVEIVAVERDFNGDNWTLEEFNNKIVRGKEGKKSLLTGNVYLNLEGGVAFVHEISFTHNSKWSKSCELRLGARVVGNLSGTRVREAVTEPFLLKDYRMTYTEKHYPPFPNDEVWRLANISKDGPFHNRLVSENIKTVKDFLIQCCINPKSLQNILGAGKIWKSTVAHAQTCKILRLYFPIGSGKKSGVVFNAMGQVMGLISECCYVLLDELSEDQKAYASKLVVSALEHMGDVRTFDDATSLISHLHLLNDAYPSYSPMLVHPSHYNCEPLHTYYGHDHTQPSSSHNNQIVPFHLPNAANPSDIPTAVKDHLTQFFFDRQSLRNDFGLQVFDGYKNCETQFREKALTPVFQELKMVLTLVCYIHKLPLAMTWVPCSACNGLGSVGVEYCARIDDNLAEFLRVSKCSHLKKGWVAGRALSSPNMLYFPDITKLSVDEYPLVPYARKCKFSGWFIICLRNINTGDDIYVLEFFWSTSSKDNENIPTRLNMILGIMEEILKDFRFASGLKLGYLSSVEVIDVQNDQKMHSVYKIQAARTFSSDDSADSDPSSEYSSTSVSNLKGKQCMKG